MSWLSRAEYMLAGPAEGLGALLDITLPDFNRGESLPLGWHWLYFLDRPRQADLGPDGHPLRNAFPPPPTPGMRRMWAGGSIATSGPLLIGQLATRRSRVARVEEKTGASGRLVFVRVEHEVEQAGRIVVHERQDIVYRPPVPRTHTVNSDICQQALDENDWAVPIDPTLLMRFSALTYNAHRIHYDRDYAREVENYPGLLTHGPLQALCMAELARAERVAPAGGQLSFDYRLLSPLLDHQGLRVRIEQGDASDNWITSVRDNSGRKTAQGLMRLTT